MGKALRVVRTLHIVDLEGRFVRDITDHVDAGTVTLASSADSQWSFKADLLAPIEIRPLIDVFAPALETHFDDGTVWAGQCGRYIVPPPASRHTRTVSLMSIDGRDLTYRLAVSSTEDVFSVETTDNPITVLTEILTDRGIPASRIHFAPKETPEGAAPAPVVFHAAKDWEPDTSWLTIANDICALIGYYRVHADDQGRVGSRPIRDRASASADVTYASGPGSMIVGDVTEDAPPMTSFANVVRVIGPDIPATSEPADTGSPTPAAGRTVRVTARLRLRESAGLSAPILLVMAVGTAAVVSGASQSANGYTWWPITATIPGLGQRSGWSAGNWLETVTNNPDPVTQPEKVKTRIEAIARNDDPASPTSTVSLGMEIVRVEKPNGIETQAQAEEQARNLLQESLSRYRKITLSTVPDPRRSLYELYGLDVRRRGTVLVDGTWLAEGWELPFGPGSMRHTLYRTDPWQRSEALG